ncbi:23539_t:CDS:2, partial [Gigaspora rosea]
GFDYMTKSDLRDDISSTSSIDIIYNESTEQNAANMKGYNQFDLIEKPKDTFTQIDSNTQTPSAIINYLKMTLFNYGNNRRLPESTQKAKVCYARVSLEHQQGDFERQIADLRYNYPGYEIISGIEVEEVVVTQKDQLCRLESEIVEWIFKKNGTLLVVFGSDICANNNKTGEFTKDLLSIIIVDSKVPKKSNETSSKQGMTHSPFFHPEGTIETQAIDDQCLVIVEKEGIE